MRNMFTNKSRFLLIYFFICIGSAFTSDASGAATGKKDSSASVQRVWDDYHKWYYDNNVWDKTSFLGVPSHKSVSDMWNYAEIISELKPSLIIEFGTHHGGSALFFSVIGRAANPNAIVFSVDIDHQPTFKRVKGDPHIELMTRSSTDPGVAKRIAELRREHKGPVFAILDSDHHMPHVLAEMELLRPLLKAGDYLIVEDSNINGHPVLEGWGPGPYEAIQEYFRRYPKDYVRDTARETKFGFTFAVSGFLKRR